MGAQQRADLIASNVYDKDLIFDPDDYPCKGHANIINWPEDHDDMKSIADELASQAQVFRYIQQSHAGVHTP